MLEKTYLFQEIHEQPMVIAQLLEHELENAQQLASAIRQRGITHVVIAARGTSDNAGRYAKYLLGSVNRLTVALATPSLFTIYEQPPNLQDALVLGISQSGKSPDIVAVLAEAKRQGALTAVITNTPDSDLGQTADFVFDLHAGSEKAVAATKTYTAELAAIALLSTALCGNEQMQQELTQIPNKMAVILSMNTAVAAIAERYRYMTTCIVVGRGYNYATAFELALKLKELTYTMVEPYSSADFLHGPLALLAPGFPAIVLAPSGKLLPELRDFIHKIKQRQAEVVIISDDAETLALGRIPLRLPCTVPEWLSPITTIVTGQLFAMHLAYVRDFDVDQPRAIQKVTETI